MQGTHGSSADSNTKDATVEDNIKQDDEIQQILKETTENNQAARL